jgi:hypothetical protein
MESVDGRGRACELAAKDPQRALGIARSVLGARHPTVGHVLQSAASLSRARGDRAAAEDHLREAYAIFRESFGDDNPWTVDALEFHAAAAPLTTVVHPVVGLNRQTLGLRVKLRVTKASPEIILA